MKIDYVTWAVMVIALAGLFWNVNTGFNLVHDRMDRMQAETNARFDQMFDRMDRMQAETNARFDQMFDRMDRMQAETNARFDQMFDRMDRMQAETNRRFDAILETIMGFDRRVSRNEGQIEVIRDQLQAEGVP